MTNLRVVDNDRDEISVMDGDKQVRGWSYADETERRVKMLCAREFVEGFYHELAANRELVEALETMVQAATFSTFNHSDSHPLPMARAALSRARGEG